LEVFLVRRHANIAFMGGAHVFPGGRVDDADSIDDAARWCDGVAEAVDRMRGRSADQAVAFHVAALRELFEEAGVLLARDAGGMVAIGTADEERFGVCRREMMDHRLTMRDLAEREQVRLALNALALFAHWVTPEIETRRFDTYFFFAIAPDVQEAAHDQRETTEGTWIAPAEALERSLRGEIALPPPTWTTLRALARCPSVEAAWAWAQSQPVARVQPRVTERSDGARIIALPGDPLCPAVDGFEAEETRFLLENGRWKPL
jgi:8-oxo-dGTP pyrophosphatase MutT (NUDIX family)